jgi:hypothetical protein
LEILQKPQAFHITPAPRRSILKKDQNRRVTWPIYLWMHYLLMHRPPSSG